MALEWQIQNNRGKEICSGGYLHRNGSSQTRQFPLREAITPLDILVPAFVDITVAVLC